MTNVSIYGVALQVSKISLVDLAGSERAKDTGAEGKRLQVRVHIATAELQMYIFPEHSLVMLFEDFV